MRKLGPHMAVCSPPQIHRSVPGIRFSLNRFPKVSPSLSVANMRYSQATLPVWS